MAGDKRILTEVLLEAAVSKQPDPDLAQMSERLRAALLINSSSSPEACGLADNVEYRATSRWQGLSTKGAQSSISAVFEALSHAPNVPTDFEVEEPEISIQDFQAAMVLTATILRAFEYSDDEPAEAPPDLE
ncbi:MAG: hypothetical protein K0V04_04210 [Deltaproteobacteria bacterium]|nr:hypothetical protein [Deltaproteobacteria bacterium]